MPTPGLSLVGFLDQAPAVHLLREACIPANPTDAALIADWQLAKGRLQLGNPPVQNPGQPAIAPIPQAEQAYIQALTAQQWVANYLAQVGPTYQFAMVELDPLLAYQFNVDTARSHHHCNGINGNSPVSDLLPICLPQAPPSEPFRQALLPQSMIIKSRSLNLMKQGQGQLAPHAIGIFFGVSIPLLHVVRWNNRCYLHNGFHRAIGMRLAGVQHAPCLLRDVNTAADAGIRADGATFSEALLTSGDPPTIAHFINRAWPVQIRAHSRVLHVSWAEYTIADE